MSTLEATLLGPPSFVWAGEALVVPTRKAMALLCWLAAEGRPGSRDGAAALLWGPGKLRNLRQELYVLRKLPGAQTWLEVGERLVLRARTDLDELVVGRDPTARLTGFPLDGLDGVRAEGWQLWLAELRHFVAGRRERCAVAWARSRLDIDETDAAWAVLEPLLQVPSVGEPVWRTAVEVRLRRGERDAAHQLIESARRVVHTQGPRWTSLEAQVHGSPGARLRSLPAAVVRVLRFAALDLEALPVDLLGEAVGLGPMELAEAIQALHEAGLWVDGAPEHGVRDEVLGALAPAAVKVLHGRLATLLQARGHRPGRIAIHLELAELSSSVWWLASARRTGRLEAVRGALRTAASPEEASVAHIEEVLVCRRAGDVDGARAAWRALEDHAVRTQEPRALNGAAFQGALLDAMTGQLAGAEQHVAEAIALTSTSDPAVAALRGALAFFSGRPADAGPLLAQAVTSNDPDLRLMALNMRGAVAGHQGDVDLADQLHTQALAEARALGRLHVATRLLNSAGANALLREELGTAVDRLDQAMRLAEEIGDREALAGVLFNLGNAWTRTGAFGLARPLIRDLLDLAQVPRTRGLGCRCRSDLERSVGRFEEAAAWSGRAIRAFEEAGDPVQTAVSRFNLALAEVQLDGTAVTRARLRGAHSAISEVARPDLTNAAATELALQEDTADRIEALVGDRQTTTSERAAGLRARLMRGDVSRLPPGVGTTASFLGGYVDALAAVALNRSDPGRSDRLRAATRQRVSAWGDGLLTDQQEALSARLGRWIEDPVSRF